MSKWLVERTSGWLAARTTRRGFLQSSALAATALSVAPVDYVLHPVSAYAAICACAGRDCNCGALCCDGYTQFCCTINDGVNACPPGTFAGGWWKADGSIYCAGPRYYVDCHSQCQCSAGCSSGFCTSCDGLTCGCALGDCNNRHVGCNVFRYGQCHQEVACVGRIACRVVSCTPPYVLTSACTTSSATDDYTRNHFAPCQDGPTTDNVVVAVSRPPSGGGYWLGAADGTVTAFGTAREEGPLGALALARPVVAMAPTPSGAGYWLVAGDGGVFGFGDAAFHGSLGGVRLVAPIVAAAPTPSGAGYWLAASDGGVFAFGDARFHGSLGGVRLVAPIVAAAPTPSGAGYWLAASDGGVFAFGDARFHGSLGGTHLQRPIVGITATPSAAGYWLAASDGGVFAFGDARFHGSLGGTHLQRPIVGITATPSAAGYWLAASDGGVFAFGDATFLGNRLG